MTTDLCPNALTIDYVLQHFTKVMRHRIRTFKVSDPVDDCFHQILLAMITPSEALGSTYLERYNPSRGPAQHYVMMFCVQQMMKLHQREKHRQSLLPVTVRLEYEPEDYESPARRNVVHESTVPDQQSDHEEWHNTIRSPEDLYRFFEGTRYVQATSRSSSGEPRSTVYMLELLLFGHLTISEIAARLEVTPAEVHRRFKALRKEPRLRPLIQDTAVA